MKKILKQLVALFILMNLGLTAQMLFSAENATAAPAASQPAAPAASQPAAPTDSKIFNPIEELIEIGKNTGLPDFNATGQHPDAPPDYQQEGVGTLTSPILFAIDLFRYVVSGIALIMIVIAVIKLVSTSNEEEAGKAKSTLILGGIGLLLIQFADVAVKKMFFGEQGEAFEDIATTQIYAEESVKQFRGVIGFVEAFVGIIAVLVIVIRGLTLITSAGDEEALTKAKNHIIYALVGLGIVALSELVVRGIIFPEAGTKLPEVGKGRYIIYVIVNYLSGFISIVAFAGLFYGGYKYVVSAGNEEATEKTKKVFYGALIALVLALGAFALVNTIIKIEPTT